MHFTKTQKKFFVNNFCASELETIKFLTLQKAVVTQISVASSSPNFHAGKSVFLGIGFFAFRAAINISYRKITAKRAAPIFVYLE